MKRKVANAIVVLFGSCLGVAGVVLAYMVFRSYPTVCIILLSVYSFLAVLVWALNNSDFS